MSNWDAAANGSPSDNVVDQSTITTARRVVAANSLDAPDCRALLSMLGIAYVVDRECATAAG